LCCSIVRCFLKRMTVGLLPLPFAFGFMLCQSIVVILLARLLSAIMMLFDLFEIGNCFANTHNCCCCCSYMITYTCWLGFARLWLGGINNKCRFKLVWLCHRGGKIAFRSAPIKWQANRYAEAVVVAGSECHVSWGWLTSATDIIKWCKRQ